MVGRVMSVWPVATSQWPLVTMSVRPVATGQAVTVSWAQSVTGSPLLAWE